MLCILHLTLYTVLIVLSTVWVVFHFKAYTATFVISANENELMKGTLQITAYSLHRTIYSVLRDPTRIAFTYLPDAPNQPANLVS